MNHKAGFIKSAMLLMGILVLTACGNSGAGTVEKSVGVDVQAAEMSTSGNVNETSKHILVAFFSEAGEQYRVGTIEKGNTQTVAEMIAQKTGADLFHIERKTAYPKTYNDLLQAAQDEQKKTARPELSASVENWNDYDTVFIGYPIWWGDMPMPVYTFLENHDFTGKTVIPFDTNEGSGLAGTVQSVKNSCPGAIVKEGLAIEGKTAQKDPEKTEQEVNEWLNKNGFSRT